LKLPGRFCALACMASIISVGFRKLAFHVAI